MAEYQKVLTMAGGAKLNALTGEIITPAPASTPAPIVYDSSAVSSGGLAAMIKTDIAAANKKAGVSPSTLVPTWGGSTTPPEGATPAIPYSTPAVSEPTTQTDAYAQLTKQAQDEISKIEQIYSDLTKRADVGEEADISATNAATLAAGLAGSGTAMTAIQASKGKGEQAKTDIAAQLASSLGPIYARIQSGSFQLAQMGQAELQQAETDVTTFISTLATSGISGQNAINQIKKNDPTFYQHLNDLGYSDFQIANLIDNDKNNPNRPEVKEVPMSSPDGQNTIIKRITFDPVTGKSTEQDYTINIPYAAFSNTDTTKTINGRLLQLQPNGTYKDITPSSIPPTKTPTAIGKDAMGNTIYGIYNEKTGGYDPIQIPTTNGTPDTSGLYDDFVKNLTPQGKAYFDGLNEIDKGNVQLLINGDALSSDIAKGLGGAKYAQTLIQKAKAVDPTYSEAKNKQRYQYKVQFNNPNGKDQQSIGGINTALGHIAELAQSFNALKNTGNLGALTIKYNSLVNWIKGESSDPNVQTFDYTLNQLATEIGRAYMGGVPDEITIKQNYDALSKNLSPEAGNQVMQRAVELLASKISSLARQYKGVMGKFPDPEVILQGFPVQELKDQKINTSKIDKIIKDITNPVQPVDGGNQPPSSTPITYNSVTGQDDQSNQSSDWLDNIK